MSGRVELFGLYLPGRSLLHRIPVAGKFALVFAASLLGLLLRQWPVSVGALAGCVALLLGCRLGVRRCLALPAAVWVMVALLVAYQLVWGTWRDAALVVANLLLCVYAARMLTLTTPAPVLLDALVVAARPLKLIGVQPERVGLAAAIMLRSIPHLLASFDEVRDAARARGLERNLLARVSPVVVQAVAYAQTTGGALAARGLGEGDEDSG
ncbi:cobalt transporter [Enemella dayhoffiae]|uniref:Cobalt transporter n=1 Tax=Enemella dayhoffiae TaxID=2016507 RepID=A0A255GU73_9ACTN|nr:energy-coupling factor transporter transmembrane component T [Enemella dayhoffiae]OYO18346.1 cobalt transporter [Enemella dayhoffiae]